MSLFASNRTKTTLKVLGTFALFTLLVTQLDLNRIGDSLASAKLGPFLLATSFLIPAVLIKTYKWLLLLRQHREQATFSEAFKSLCAGVTLANVTPFSAGEVARGSILPTASQAELVGKTLLDKGIDLFCVVSATGISLALLAHQPYLSALVAGLSLIIIFNLHTILTFCSRFNYFGLGRIPLLHRILDGLSQASRKTILSTFLLAVLFYSFFYLQTLILLNAYASNVPTQAIFYFPLITLSTVFPLTIGGVGVREGIAILLLEPLGIPGEIAFNTFFMLFVIDNVTVGLLGLFFISKKIKAKP